MDYKTRGETGDPSNPRARIVDKVVENAKNVMEAVASAVETGEPFLVLGGDCTNGVGAINGVTRDQNLPRELVTTNREKSVAAFWPTVSCQILAPA